MIKKILQKVPKGSSLNHKKGRTLVLMIFIFVCLTGFFQPADASVKLNTPSINRLTSGIVGLWSFDAPDVSFVSNTATDRSGNTNTGTFINMSTSTARAAGALGQALKFDGTNDYVSVPNNASLVIGSGGFSMSAWIYKIDNTSRVVLATRPLNGGDATSAGYVLGVANNDGKIYTHISDGTVVTLDCVTSLIPNNTWTHIVAVRNTVTDTLRAYVNGAQDCSVNDNTSAINSNSTGLKIGAGSAGDSLFWNDRIDDVRIYNRALTVAEIKSLSNLGRSKYQASPVTRLTSGLVGYWTLDAKDTSFVSNTTNDRSGQARTASFIGMSTSTSRVPGAIGQGLTFAGTGNYLTFNDTGLPSGAASRTISVWVKNASNVGDNYFVAWGAEGGGTNFAIGMINAGKFFIGNGMLTVEGSTDFTADKQWHHVVTTADGTNASLYVDGVLDITGALTLNTSLDGIGDIGTHFSNQYSQETDAGLDEIRIYDRVLSATEIKVLYNTGRVTAQKSQNAKLPSGLVGLWSFDGAGLISTTAYDHSGQSNTGTLTNFGEAATTSKAIGVIGQALKFDGTNDYVSVTNANSLNFTSAMTASAWINSTSPSTSFSSMVSKSDGTLPGGPFELRFSSNTQKPQFIVSAGGSYNHIVGNTQLATSTWYHVVGTYDGANLRIYVNGVSDATAVALTGTMTSQTYATLIGARYPAFPEYYFPGRIDDVRLYNRALTTAEITRLYSLGR